MNRKNQQRKKFVCVNCSRPYTAERSLWRHMKYECGQAPRFQCPYCNLRKSQQSDLWKHIKKKHPGYEIFGYDIVDYQKKIPRLKKF